MISQEGNNGRPFFVDLSSFMPDEVMLPALIRSRWGMPGYRQRIASIIGRLLSINSPSEVEGLLSLTTEQMAAYVKEKGANAIVDPNLWLDELHRLGFGAVVIHCEFDGNPDDEPDAQEKHLGNLASVYVGKVVPFGAVPPTDAEKAKIYIERAVLRRNFKGMTVLPYRYMRPPSDAAWFQIYESCQHFNIPVWIDSSMHNWPAVPMDISHPMHIDRVAAEFPNLKIIIGRAGWPWVLEAMAVAMRHSNVYIEIGGIAPAQMAKIGSGYEPLFHLGATALAHKVIFGSHWIWTGKTLDEMLQEFRTLPVPEGVRSSWLGENAIELLNIKFG